jgi:hypothetical protein
MKNDNPRPDPKVSLTPKFLDPKVSDLDPKVSVTPKVLLCRLN